MKKVYIETNGCAVLRHETHRISEYIKENNYQEIDNPKEADYIIVTGCAVIGDYEKYALDIIERLYNENKDHAKIIVAGCISTIAEKKINEISKDIIQIKNEEFDKFDQLFYHDVLFDDTFYNVNPIRQHAKVNPNKKHDPDEENDYLFANMIDEENHNNKAVNQVNYSTRSRYLFNENDLFEIRVSYGCTGKCSYCATKLAIGDFRSVKEDKILKQAEIANNMGYEEIMLMGDEIGAWQENEKNIVDLISDMLKINPKFKIGIRYIQPDTIVKYYNKLIQFFENGSIYYFCSAIQSGSERILRLMNRNPNLDGFIKCMEDMNKKNYPVIRHTQIIAGFPTETEVDVLKTLKVLQKCSFDHVAITKFSPREGTKAYELPRLEQNVIDERAEFLNDWLLLNRSNKIYKAIRNDYIENRGKRLIKKY